MTGVQTCALPIVSQSRYRLSGSILDMFNMFSGGALMRLSLFALGIMPYISSSIIMQLMTIVIPAMEQLKKKVSRVEERFLNLHDMRLLFLQCFSLLVFR